MGEMDPDYKVLYQEYRPQRFSEVVGQDNTIEALTRIVTSGRVPHAFIFHGQRGCGKTSTARIFAAALNCIERGDSYEPCGECAFCSGVSRGVASIGIWELDAASNRSIDSVREIIADTSNGSAATYKVYIIDEVHRLTPDAMSALLKTLEEPPPGVVFILATTELNRISPTIRSRATTLPFRLVEGKEMDDLVRSVATRAGIEVSDGELAAVVEEGLGSPRDTLSVLERVRAGASVKGASAVSAVTRAIADRDVSGLYVELASAVSGGDDVSTLATNLLSHWRNCLLSLVAPSLLTVSDAKFDAILTDAERIRVPRLIKLLTVVADANQRMQSSPDGRVILEAALAGVMLPEAASGSEAVEANVRDLLEVVRGLEAKVNELVARPAGPSDATSWPPSSPAPTLLLPTPVEDDEAPAPAVEPERAASVVERAPAVPEEEGAPEDEEGEDASESEDTEARPAPGEAAVERPERSVGELAEAVRASASRRLSLRLGADAAFSLGTGPDDGKLVIETASDLSEVLLGELRSIVADEHYTLSHYSRQD